MASPPASLRAFCLCTTQMLVQFYYCKTSLSNAKLPVARLKPWQLKSISRSVLTSFCFSTFLKPVFVTHNNNHVHSTNMYFQQLQPVVNSYLTGCCNFITSTVSWVMSRSTTWITRMRSFMSSAFADWTVLTLLKEELWMCQSSFTHCKYFFPPPPTNVGGTSSITIGISQP